MFSQQLLHIQDHLQTPLQVKMTNCEEATEAFEMQKFLSAVPPIFAVDRQASF